MKTLLPILCLLLLLSCYACGKIELPDNSADDTAENDGDTSGDDDSSDDGAADFLTVAEVLQTEEYSDVTVAGYIVGSVPGSRISHSLFGAEGAAESNLLIADNPDETDYERCVPVELPKGTDIREVLNLVDNPELLGSRVLLSGMTAVYFSVIGLKSVYDYEFADDAADDNETPSAEPSFPTLSDDGAEIFEGC